MVFDLGGVLVDWDRTYLYGKIFDDKDEMNYFLDNVCTLDWNAEQDAGRTWSEAIATLQKQYPKYHTEIAAFRERWAEILGDAFDDTVEILRLMKGAGYPVYALTNWSQETFPIARERLDFLRWFDGILVSGDVGLKKPDPAIFELFLQRFGLDAGSSFYVDDSIRNVETARQLGFHAVHFQNAAQLRAHMRELNLLPEQ